ncbi:ABC transporter substrate-binding protein [Pusillimonas caeni]|uniref:ABC transporter substrate-binding protein n=1 Tax=Pusillimonas caeni TaxID=1348472 RepID=UPI00143055D0|nr:ABC transporter substrate-binding protein [Pusillimonas caeni]
MRKFASGAFTALMVAWSSITGAQPTSDELESITYLLPAPKTLPAFAPYVLAEHLGYYRDAGLKLKFVSAKGGVDAAKQIGAGNAMIGHIRGDTPIMVRPYGVPIKMVALLGGGSLALIASHKEQHITEPADLKGKTITVMAYTDTTYYSLLGTMSQAGLARDDANIQAAGPAGVWQLFTSGKSDVMVAVPDWIVNARQGGADVSIMDPAKGFGTMSQAIAASEDTIENRPDLVKKVVDATLKGMALVMNDPDEAVRRYVEAEPSYSGKEAELREVFRLYNKYVFGNQSVPGKIDVDRLKAVQRFYVENGVVPKASPLDELYTNQFIED